MGKQLIGRYLDPKIFLSTSNSKCLMSGDPPTWGRELTILHSKPKWINAGVPCRRAAASHLLGLDLTSPRYSDAYHTVLLHQCFGWRRFKYPSTFSGEYGEVYLSSSTSHPSLYEWPPMLHFGVSDRCVKIYVSCDKVEILRSRRDLTNAIRPSFCKKTGSLCYRCRQILGAGLGCSDLNECD